MPEDDVTATLSELERKLKDLEDELQGSAGLAPPSSPAPTPVMPSAAAPAAYVTADPAAYAAPLLPAPAAELASPLDAQLDELVRFREQLERSARELMSEYERLLGGLRAATDAALGTPALAAPVMVAAPARAAAPPTSHAMPATAVPPPAPWQPAPGTSLDGTVLDGVITVDAGPFTDITGLSGFEQELGSVPGVRDVYVRGFEGSRALIDVTLGQPLALGAELRRFATTSFAITAAGAGRLSVAIAPGA